MYEMLMNVEYNNAECKVYNIQELNTSFASGSLRVMYLGNNRNGSHFSKEAVIKALPTLFNVPIVCHWDDDAEEIGGHDVDVVRDNDGNIRLKNLTEPCGVVPEHAKFSFETIEDFDGATREYLVIEGVLLWKRQDVFKHISEDLDGVVKHSMEIDVNKSNMTQDGYVDITDFQFTALCLLENCEPCFIGSQLELYTVQNFKTKMEQMMQDLKESFNLVNTSPEVDNTHPQNYSMEGGERVLEDKMELIAKYGIDVDSLDFSIEDFTVEELTEKFEAMQAASGEGEGADPDANTAEPTENKFALTSNIVDELYRVLGEVKIEREWGECTRYWYVDCDFEANEVYCWDSNDWLLYGFTYAIDGDSITIDFDSKKRKKYVIADFDEGEQPSPFAPVFAEMEQILHESTEWEAKYQTASDTIASMETELGELRQFKTDTETATAEGERDDVFAQFEDLVGVEAFETLRENCMEYDIETLEEKCYAIRGRNGVSTKFALENKTPKIKVEKTDVSNEPYGGIFAKYGIGSDK